MCLKVEVTCNDNAKNKVKRELFQRAVQGLTTMQPVGQKKQNFI